MSERLRLTTTGFAHGGHAVAHTDSGVVFVRHALPGETVLARVVGQAQSGRVRFAEAVEVLDASEHRVEPPCPYAVPGGCGGCDLQHVERNHQLLLKQQVLYDALRRFARLSDETLEDLQVLVQPLGDGDGLRWRTRLELAVDPAGRAGLRAHRSHDVVALDDCLIAAERLVEAGPFQVQWPRPVAAVHAVAPSEGEAIVLPVDRRGVPLEGEPVLTESVLVGEQPRHLAVDARGFWQSHPQAVATYTAYLLTHLAPQPGETAWDLYAGVGPFAAVLADSVGPTGYVAAVESGRRASAHARANLAAWPHARVTCADAAAYVDDRRSPRPDLVVLDPPRSGAGAAVCRGIAGRGPRAVGYVACDPVAVARDIATFAEEGYDVVALRGFDAFPMTHHVETIAILAPRG